VSTLDELLAANEEFAGSGPGELPKLPRRGLVILTCMDHRVDPLAALGLELGDAMVIRNAGGRVTPAVLDELEILGRIAEDRGASIEDLHLLLIQHTDCGAAKIAGLDDPEEGLRADLAALTADSRVPESLPVTASVYDTATGRITLSG
jgi:carbonic anhydrase